MIGSSFCSLLAAEAGIPCCVSADKVNSSLALGLAKLNEAATLGADVALLPEEFMCGEASCALDLHGPGERAS